MLGAGRRRDDHGTVAAEAAMVLPTLVLLGVALAWLVDVGVTHVRAVDAAREAARTVARGEPVAAGAALARRVAVPGSSVWVNVGESRVQVEVVSRIRGPGGVFGRLAPATVHARAVAATEPTAPGFSRGGGP